MGKWQFKEVERVIEKNKSVEEQNLDRKESLSIEVKLVLFPELIVFKRKTMGNMTMSGYNENMLNTQSTNLFTPCD